MKDKKKIVIGTLCSLIMIMAVGYALLSQQLSITGSTSITSNWQVEITNITEKEKSTGATTNNTNYTATTASFNTSLTSPGDYAIYEVTVTNKGTLDAVLSAEPSVTAGNNTAIQYELEGIKKGDKIRKNNQTDTFTIKVQYNPATTKQPSTLTSNIEVTLNYEQDLGQVSPYDYSIGDTISFAGSNWRVIKNSPSEEDYITLIKETGLTYNEFGNYGSKFICTNSLEQLPWQGYGGCNTPGEEKLDDSMPFYWSSTCHNGPYPNSGVSVYGQDSFTDSVTSGCEGHNDYAGSKIKELLEGEYLSAIDPNSNKLKSVEIGGTSYKVRLITGNELKNNLGYITSEEEAPWGGTYIKTRYTETTPEFISQYSNNWWTMTSDDNSTESVVFINGGDFNTSSIINSAHVRPVINLLKSSIE